MAEEQTAQPRPWVRRIRIVLMILGPAVLIAGGLWYYLSARGTVSTDDAYIEANRVSISPQIEGRVIAVPVHENEPVEKGQVLLHLDPAPYRAALAAARAKLASAGDQVAALKAQYQALGAQISGAEAQVAYLEREVKRQGPLARKNVVTNAKLDQIETQRQQAVHQVAMLKAQRDQVLAKLGGNPDQPAADNAAYRDAEAAVTRARLDLSYTVLRAPATGVVAAVNVRPGDVLSAGEPAFPLIETAEVWVKANFKETALTHVRPGQRATVTVDTYPGHTWKGRVASISPASGQVFSLLPPQNATGNWVKVVQRIPVRIAIDSAGSGPVLRAGMSAEVKIDVSGQ